MKEFLTLVTERIEDKYRFENYNYFTSENLAKMANNKILELLKSRVRE